MSNKRKLSAKDLAFNRERDSFRKRINKLKSQLNGYQNDLKNKDDKILELEKELQEKNEELSKLYELSNLNREEVLELIDSSRSRANALEAILLMSEYMG